MKATALLIEDHRQIRRALDVLAQMSTRTAKQGSFDVVGAQDLLNFLQQFADRHHQGKEEGVFFPALLQDRAQKHYPSLCALVFEHNRERSLAEGLEEAVRTRKAKDFAYYADRLVEILRAHIDKEENDVFAIAETTFDAGQDERVTKEMQSYEQSWLQTGLPALLRRQTELESDYLEGNSARRVSA